MNTLQAASIQQPARRPIAPNRTTEPRAAWRGHKPHLQDTPNTSLRRIHANLMGFRSA